MTSETIYNILDRIANLEKVLGSIEQGNTADNAVCEKVALMKTHTVTSYSSPEDFECMDKAIVAICEKVTALEEHCKQLQEERRALLNIKSTDGLLSSEWIMRTAKAEQKVEDLKKTSWEIDAMSLIPLYHENRVLIASLCDDIIDPSGQLLGKVRELWRENYNG